MAIPNATAKNIGVSVMLAVICKNAPMIPITKLAIRAMPVQSRLLPQFTIDIEFTSFTNNVCKNGVRVLWELLFCCQDVIPYFEIASKNMFMYNKEYLIKMKNKI